MADVRDQILAAMTVSAAATLPLAGGHHAEEMIEWDRKTYPVAGYFCQEGNVQYVGDNGPGNPRLQRRMFRIQVEVYAEDADDLRQQLSGYRVALEKAFVPSRLSVPVDDIVLVADSGIVELNRENARGTIGCVGLIYVATCHTFEGHPDVLVTPLTPVPVNEGIFDE